MRRIERIERPDDPRIGDYRNIKDATLIKKSGRFIIEGTEVVRTAALFTRFPIRSLFLRESHLERMRDVFERLPPDVPIYSGSIAVMSAIAGFDVHRGCLAVGSCTVLPSGEALAEDLARPIEQPSTRKIVLVLEGLSNHDNVGGIFRNAAAFGATAVLLDPSTADPLYRKSIRVSMGAALTVPFARFSAWPEGLALLGRVGFSIWAMTPRAEAEDLGAHALASGSSGGGALPDKVALLFGSEGYGLSEAALSLATGRYRIPIEPSVDSLNVATASAIALFALKNARR